MSLPLTWPPVLATYKNDLKLDLSDTRYDTALQYTLDAAVAFVERARPDVDYSVAQDNADLPVKVTADLVLGTLRYARREDVRRETPVGVMVAGEVGSTGLAQWDADIERLLRIGRFAKIRFA